MDNIFANLFRFRQTREATPQPITPGVPSSSNEQAPKVTGGSFQERIIFARSPLTALTVSAVYCATEKRAKTLGIMPVQYRKKDFAGGNYVEDLRGLGKRINYLLQKQPNPIMTATSLWEQVTINRIMWGNGFVYIQRDDMGIPVNLWLVYYGSYDIANGTYNIGYLSDIGYVEKVNVPREDVLHFPNTFRYQNGFWGISTLQYAAETLSIIKTQKNQTLEIAAKGGRMKLIIGESLNNGQMAPISSGTFDPKEVDKYAIELNEKIYKQDVIALRNLNSVQNISMSAQDMQLLEQMNLGLDDVARFWGVPRPMLMLDTNSHYNDYQNASMEFYTRTVLPDKADMEDEIFRKLIGFEGYGYRDIHICEEPLLAMDPERQAKVDQLLLQNGTKTVNEIRQKHDMPAVADGDEPLASANLLTLKALIAKSEAATTLKPGNYTVGEPPKEGEETA